MNQTADLSNPLLLIFLGGFFLRTGIQILLSRLNISHLREHGDKVPEIFRDTLDREKLARISAYTADQARFGMAASLADQGLVLLILLSGFLPGMVEVIRRWGLGPISEGLTFFALLALLSNLFRIPFSLYETFGIEARYGFNTKTARIWITDLLKSLVLSAVLGGLLLALLLALISHGGAVWWIWAWVTTGVAELLILWLYPLIIAPLFNKFEPVEDEGLKERIHALMARAGLLVRGVFQIDASRRSRHTNAYFTGLGRSKRIVLFDTLLKSHGKEEILAILSHEAGHWKKKHILKQLLLMEGASFLGFYVAARLLGWPLLYQTFGFQEVLPYAGLFLIGAVFGPFAYFIQPLTAALSRKFEREADDFSRQLMDTAEPLRGALKRLAVDNLANVVPHPLYAWFYYSHPPLADRISRLKGT